MTERVIGVIGAGTMGAGIAEAAARAFPRVRLYDVNEEAVQRGIATMRASLQRVVSRGKLSADEAEATLERVAPALDLEELADCTIVIEAAPERLDIKRTLFGRLGEVCASDALLATNTSSLSVTEIAAGVPSPERVLGLHFFNPAPVLPLVEVVRTHLTSETILERARSLVASLGKQPVLCADTPGFIVNRVARPFYLEGQRLVGDGYATIERVDSAARALGFRMGPFELMDLIGVDVNLAVSVSLFEQTRFEPRFRPHPFQEAVVRSGRLGRKTGQGFYDYRGDPPAPSAETHAAMPPPAGPWDEWGSEPGDGFIRGRLLTSLVNEAFWTAGQRVATRDDIDAAMRLGTSWPRGPFAWAEQVGLPRIVRTLQALRQAHGDAYLPAPLLRQQAQQGAGAPDTPGARVQ